MSGCFAGPNVSITSRSASRLPLRKPVAKPQNQLHKPTAAIKLVGALLLAKFGEQPNPNRAKVDTQWAALPAAAIVVGTVSAPARRRRPRAHGTPLADCASRTCFAWRAITPPVEARQAETLQHADCAHSRRATVVRASLTLRQALLIRVVAVIARAARRPRQPSETPGGTQLAR
eukprot:scaffold30163_cov124-Isochrysis_galbana.AAC.4